MEFSVEMKYVLDSFWLLISGQNDIGFYLETKRH